MDSMRCSPVPGENLAQLQTIGPFRESGAAARSRLAAPKACLTSGLLALTLLLVFEAAGAWSNDGERGREVFGQCKRCHQVGSDAKHRIGPHLNDVFGRVAGSHPDFRYSRAMREAGVGGLVWDHAKLDAFLADPRALVPRSRMSFDGIEDIDDRAALIAWLQGYSGNAADLPPAEPTAVPEDYGLDAGILAVAGDPEYGAYLAGECITCHRTDGADKGIPSIVGWPVDDFVIALHAYKRGTRVNPVMQMVAGRLSSEEIAALAAHFNEAEGNH